MRSITNKITLKTVRQARSGHEASRSKVAKRAQERIYAFLYRITLDEHLAEDLCQDTLLELFRSLSRLELTSVESFWGWVYRTALGKAQHHFRKQGTRRLHSRTLVDTEFLSRLESIRDSDPAQGLWRREIVEAIIRAVSVLKTEYRTVIAMRCAENLSFSQIASVLGGSKARSRLLFYRARKALQKQLKNQGLKRSSLLGALTVFVTITSHGSKQALAITPVSVSTASLNIGPSTYLLHLATSKIVGISAAVLLTTSASVVTIAVRQKSPPRLRPAQAFSIGNLYDKNNRFFVMLSVPSSVYEPNNGGWQGFHLLTQGRPVVFIDPLRSRPLEFFIIVPENHMLELTLPSPLVDGAGADVYADIHMWRRRPRVVLSNGADQEIEVPASTYAGAYPRGFCLLGYDISSIQLDFEPKVLRFYGVNDTGLYGASAFHDFVVRVQK
ncbi:MAG: sigma-70 family RNA polymerase sigma factor [Phycisphaerales bacterium]|jgi:RNA polymerase sigma-70 factor (ECF subfamily)